MTQTQLIQPTYFQRILTYLSQADYAKMTLIADVNPPRLVSRMLTRTAWLKETDGEIEFKNPVEIKLHIKHPSKQNLISVYRTQYELKTAAITEGRKPGDTKVKFENIPGIEGTLNLDEIVWNFESDGARIEFTPTELLIKSIIEPGYQMKIYRKPLFVHSLLEEIAGKVPFRELCVRAGFEDLKYVR
jgi:hypothetical protein